MLHSFIHWPFALHSPSYSCPVPKIPADPYQLVSAMSHTAGHLCWEPSCLANFLHYKCIAPQFNSAHFLDLLLQLSTVESLTHSHNHLSATFGSFLRPSCLLQPPLQLSHRISPSSSMRKWQTMIFLFQQLCLLFPLPLLQLLPHSSLLQMKNLLWGSPPFFYLPLSQSYPASCLSLWLLLSSCSIFALTSHAPLPLYSHNTNTIQSLSS